MAAATTAMRAPFPASRRQIVCNPNAASGISAVMSRGSQRDGTRNAGTTSQSRREGIGYRRAEDVDRARGRERKADQEGCDERAGHRPRIGREGCAAAKRDQEPCDRECKREQAEVVADLRRVRSVAVPTPERLERVAEQDVPRRGNDELDRVEAVEGKVSDSALQAGPGVRPGRNSRDAEKHDRRERECHRAQDQETPPPSRGQRGARARMRPLSPSRSRRSSPRSASRRGLPHRRGRGATRTVFSTRRRAQG